MFHAAVQRRIRFKFLVLHSILFDDCRLSEMRGKSNLSVIRPINTQSSSVTLVRVSFLFRHFGFVARRARKPRSHAAYRYVRSMYGRSQRRLDKQAAKHHGYQCLIARGTSLILWLSWSEHL